MLTVNSGNVLTGRLVEIDDKVTIERLIDLNNFATNFPCFTNSFSSGNPQPALLTLRICKRAISSLGGMSILGLVCCIGSGLRRMRTGFFLRPRLRS